MENHLPTRQSLLRYLLHETDEDERERVDTMLLEDEVYHAAFQEVEYDLLDSLHAGELTDEEAARARRALRTEGRLVGLPLTARHSTAAHPLSPSPSLPAAPIAQRAAPRRFGGLSSPSRWLQDGAVWAAIAAVVLIALAVGWSRRLVRPSEAPIRATTAAPVSPIGPDSGPSHSPIDPAAQGQRSVPGSAALAVLLLPPASRSPHMLHLAIAQNASAVQIDWPFHLTGASHDGYQFQVLTDAGKAFCTSQGVVVAGVDPPVIRFTCRASDVPSGIDFLRVTSLPSDPNTPPLSEVTVSVDRKPASAR